MKTHLKTTSRDGERGAVSLKALFVLFVLAAVAFALIKFVPVYVEQQQVKHELDDFANRAAIRNLNDAKIALEVKKLLTDFSLPDGSIKVTAKDRRVQVVLGYKRDIDLLLTSYTWQVDYTANGKEL
jgi:hypothetical protein